MVSCFGAPTREAQLIGAAAGVGRLARFGASDLRLGAAGAGRLGVGANVMLGPLDLGLFELKNQVNFTRTIAISILS